MIRSHRILIFFFLFVPFFLQSQNGRILIVHGSDTAVNGGLDVGREHPTLTTSLYTQPGFNAYKIMNPAYRDTIVDSYGHPLIMTWWMLTGSMFRASTNRNVPYPSPLTLHLMKKYHGAAIAAFGDELTLHYHTWVWSDYDADGVFHWNQARSFTDCEGEFVTVLAENLLEEENFPVSFRSGWHYMDDAWQNFLDQWIPFSLHNDWPAKRLVDPEPIDNIYDWSRSSSDWIPFHPSLTDYQIPGSGRSWNTRSESIETVSKSALEQAFVQAKQGKNQVLCLWDHLADDNIFPSLSRVNKLLHELSSQYGIPFEFKTAAKAMQIWLGTLDSLPPLLTFSENRTGESITFSVETSDPIFQIHPFVAVKTVDEQYDLVEMVATDPTSWVSLSSYPAASLVKAAAAVTDTVGNLSTAFLRYLPDDMFVDDGDPKYEEWRGSWTSIPSGNWGADYRTASVNPGDSATVAWSLQSPQTLPYKFFVQIPSAANRVQRATVQIHTDGNLLVKELVEPLVPNSWIYVGTASAPAGTDVTLEMTFKNESEVVLNAGADAVKMSPLVQAFDIATHPEGTNLGYVSAGETLSTPVLLENQGTASQTIVAVQASEVSVAIDHALPITLSPGSSILLHLSLTFLETGSVQDTIIFSAIEHADDPVRFPFSATVETAVRILDNDDPKVYKETGIWSTSVVTAYGSSSRISYLTTGPGQFAAYWTAVPRGGYYNLFQLIPPSTNATNRALVTVVQGNDLVDSVYVDQQAASGWMLIGIHRFTTTDSVEIRVINDGTSTLGDVLRADAMRLSWQDESVQTSFVLDNNGPGYAEHGSWNTSVAQAYGPSSRYASLSPPGNYASFLARVILAGTYNIDHIIPASQNATNHALYTVTADGQNVDSVFLDQTAASGQWERLGRYKFGHTTLVEVRITNAGGYTGGSVIRADAVRIVLDPATSVEQKDFSREFSLRPNYPNPFNPETAISFEIPEVRGQPPAYAGTGAEVGPSTSSGLNVRVAVYDLLGREVAVLIDEMLPAGKYKAAWDASRFPSGVYLCRMQAGSFTAVRKMVLVK